MDNLQSMTSAELLNSEKSVTFNRKLLFAANQDLIKTRGCFPTLPIITVNHSDLWSIKPPDFSPKLYRSINLPQIKKTTLDPAILNNGLAELSRRSSTILSLQLSKSDKKRNDPAFIASYRPPCLLDVKLQFVKSGQFPCCPYTNPKPHNFRPCDENLPEMLMSIEKDPGNLNFKTQILQADTGVQIKPKPLYGDLERKMITFKPAEPKWDKGLILPRSPWPPKSATYTRHRRRRGVYSAFMGRVEEKLTRSWMK